MKKCLLILLLLCGGAVTDLPAQKPAPDTVLKVSGKVVTPLSLTFAQIIRMPQHMVKVKDKKGKVHTYKGVYIQDMLSRAGVTMGSQLRGENLSKYVLAVCADGYQVVYSLAELDSSFVRDLPIIACQIDGRALNSAKGPLRIIMPGDKKPARNCFQLKELIVRSASN